MKRTSLFLWPILGLFACGESTPVDTPATEQPTEVATTPAVAEVTKVKYYSGDKIPSDLSFEFTGTATKMAEWDDANGHNTLILTLEDATEEYSEEWQELTGFQNLYAYHYIVKDGGTPSLLWKVQDFVEECAFDIMLYHMDDALEITDLDDDGIAESLFIYRADCVSDVSPLGMKLMMHEHDIKYALRGNSRVYPMGETELPAGGDFVPDPAFNDAPSIFLEFASEKWNDFMEL